MVNKLKAICFSILKKIVNPLRGRGLSKIPFLQTMERIFHYFLFRFFWSNNIIDIQGSKMYVDVLNKSHSMRKTFQHYASDKIHEKTTTEIFKKVIKKGDIVLDIGANIGYFTLLSANLAGEKGRVYSFEPEPTNFKYLTKNIKLNAYNHVTANQKAVSDKDGEKVKLYICSYESGHHTINQPKGIKDYGGGAHSEINPDFIEVETVSIDKFCDENIKSPVNVIKLDVEGAEFLALLGMNQTIKESKNLKMFIEFFPLLIRDMGHSPEEFARKILEDYGFSVFIISDDYNAMKGKNLKINNVDELMSVCKGKEDHVNLFLEKGDKIFTKIIKDI